MKKYESLVAVYTCNSIKITKGEKTFINDNKKQADYIK